MHCHAKLDLLWRKGSSSPSPVGSDDELTLVIETDLSCLFRNSLWLHNQAVAARKRMLSSPFCPVIPDSVWEESKEHIIQYTPSAVHSRQDETEGASDGRCGIVRVDTKSGKTVEHAEDKKVDFAGGTLKLLD
jgi:hypothetical protein